ncbi:MAG: hypothetical protein RPR28_06420 [Cycloclasticus sp.]
MRAPSLEFKPLDHTYWLGDVRLTSVTQLLSFQDFSGIPPDILEYKCKLGTFTHRAIELYLQNNLDPNSLDPRVKEYFDSWLNWWNAHSKRIEIIGVEVRFYHSVFLYAGQIDLHCMYDGKEAVIDWKCAAQHSPIYKLQTAGYQLGSNDFTGGNVQKRGALIIGKSGQCKMFWHDDNLQDAAGFTGLINTHTWRLNNERTYADKFTATH